MKDQSVSRPRCANRWYHHFHAALLMAGEKFSSETNNFASIYYTLINSKPRLPAFGQYEGGVKKQLEMSSKLILFTHFHFDDCIKFFINILYSATESA